VPLCRHKNDCFQAYHDKFRLDVLCTSCQGNSVWGQKPQQTVSQAGATAADPLAHGIARMPGRKNCFMGEKVKAHTVKRYGVQTAWGCPVHSVHGTMLCTVSPEPVPTHSPVCQGLLWSEELCVNNFLWAVFCVCKLLYSSAIYINQMTKLWETVHQV